MYLEDDGGGYSSGKSWRLGMPEVFLGLISTDRQNNGTPTFRILFETSVTDLRSLVAVT